MDYLVNTHVSDDVRIAYVYCDYKDQVIQTASNLIACLARQLVGWPRRLPRQLERLYKELEPQRRRPSLEELRSLLATLCNERRRTFVVVDAVDECEAMQQRRYFLPLLKSLPHGSTRLFVTSRPNNEDICFTFAAAPQIQIAAPESEIQRFVAEKMEERNDFIDRITPVLRDEIIFTISTRASGMYVSLQKRFFIMLIHSPFQGFSLPYSRLIESVLREQSRRSSWLSPPCLGSSTIYIGRR